MLYKKNESEKLDTALFINPTSEYRATPFWSWNCKLDKAQLMRQIEYLKEMGFGGFHMHSRTGLDTDYLGDEFMDMVKACCDKAEEEQMLAWLYDEDRWSSGPAGGKVTAIKKFRRKRLTLFTEDKGRSTPKPEALESGEPYLLACYDVDIDADGFVSYRRIAYADTAVHTKWYAYCVNEAESSWFNDQTYIDAMDGEAMREFLRVTHERYKECIGDRFGSTVPAIFTDEPNVNHEHDCAIPSPYYTGRLLYGWTRFFEEEYKKAFGQDILDVLPELVWNRRDRSDSIVKYRYFELVSRLFSENFCGQLGKWCDDNGIAFTGHLLREPELYSQAITCGETMRCYGEFGIPGIDILCDLHEFTTAKQTQSAVHQYGKEGMLSELYGVTNWDYDFRGHKSQGDWQAALGVTVRVPHLSYVSMAGEAKRDYPASINYQSPWYKEYPFIENHFARLNTALTRGTPIVDIGVIHPVESFWISCGPLSQTSLQRQALESTFKNVTGWLINNSLDFDFVCESQLPLMSDAESPDAVGRMHYKAMVVPGCITLRKTTLDFLDRFKKNGGSVIFMGGCPDYCDGVKSDDCKALYSSCTQVNIDCASLTSALETVRELSINVSGKEAAQDFLYNYRKDNDCRWLFIAHGKSMGESRYTTAQNDVLSPTDYTITVKGEFVPEEYDTITGDIRRIPFEHKNGNTVIDKRLCAFDSILIRLSQSSSVAQAQPSREYEQVRTINIKDTVSYSLSEQNVLLLDIAQYAIDDGGYADREELLRADNKIRDILGYRHREGKLAQPYTMKEKPITHTVRLKFTFESEITLSGASLALEDAENIKIEFNGKRVESCITGYFTDESIKTVKLPEIKAGENTLILSVPFGERTNIEWCYILGDFGVSVAGTRCTIIPRKEKVGFGDIVPQGMPFYGANITYNIPVTMPEDGALKIRSSYYRGSLIAVSLDGKRQGRIVFPPYDCLIENVSRGGHTISLTLFGNRHNSFGALHNVNGAQRWFGPGVWRTSGDEWCYEYRTNRFGILKSPEITILK